MLWLHHLLEAQPCCVKFYYIHHRSKIFDIHDSASWSRNISDTHNAYFQTALEVLTLLRLPLQRLQMRPAWSKHVQQFWSKRLSLIWSGCVKNKTRPHPSACLAGVSPSSSSAGGDRESPDGGEEVSAAMWVEETSRWIATLGELEEPPIGQTSGTKDHSCFAAPTVYYGINEMEMFVLKLSYITISEIGAKPFNHCGSSQAWTLWRPNLCLIQACLQAPFYWIQLCIWYTCRHVYIIYIACTIVILIQPLFGLKSHTCVAYLHGARRNRSSIGHVWGTTCFGGASEDCEYYGHDWWSSKRWDWTFST